MSQPQDSSAGAVSSLPSSTTEADSQQAAQITVDAPPDERDSKTGKRRFFGLGKKKEDKTASSPSSSTTPSKSIPQPVSTGTAAQTMSPNQPTALGPAQPVSPGKAPVDLRPHPRNVPVSPSRQGYPSAIAASPSRLRSSSPRLHSPASSEIFERNVQEPAQISTLQNELTPAHIPAHVMTEDLIPPALEASAQAITSEELNPDEVEIVMSSSHQPAAASVLESSTSHADLTALNSPLHKLRSEDSDLPSSSLLHHSGTLPPLGLDGEDTASNYGQLDPTDVRRLSFISFADVVQSEHLPPPPPGPSAGLGAGEVGSRDSLHMASFTPGTAAAGADSRAGRAASPLRSAHSPPLGSGLTTPPLSGATGPLLHSHLEQSPVRSPGVLPSSPLATLQGQQQHGELTIETMRQAVRKTASGDLSAVRSPAGVASPGLSSPISSDDGAVGRSRGNT